jgi:hypothetical protein
MAKQSQSHSQFDDLFTEFVDSDQQWGPLLFLRPRVDEALGIARVLALSVLIGGAFGLLGSIFLAAAARASHRPPLPVHLFPLLLTALYFSICQLTFVPAWNRRAARLAKRDRA